MRFELGTSKALESEKTPFMVLLRLLFLDSRRAGNVAARHRLITTASPVLDVFLDSSKIGKEDEGMQGIADLAGAFPVRKYPVYRRRPANPTTFFGRLDYAASLLDAQVDSTTYANLLKRCTSSKALAAGKEIHAHIVKRRREADVYLMNLIVQMYGNCRSLPDACAVFEGMKERNVYSWTLMIAANALNGHNRGAIEIYFRMLQEGLRPDIVTFISVVCACGSSGALAEGRLIHSHILAANYDLSYVSVTNALIKMYGKCRSLEEALLLFDRMPVRDTVSYSAMISAYAKCERPHQALACFENMGRAGLRPTSITYTTILGVCASIGALEEGVRIHGMIERQGLADRHVQKVALFDLYSKCGDLQLAKKMFDSLERKDVVSWTAMMATYAQAGHPRKAFNLFDQMQTEGYRPNEITFISLLGGCNNVHTARNLRKRFQASGLESLAFGNAIITRFGKLGAVDDARSVFDRMLDSSRSVVSWSAMVAAYAQNGHTKEAFVLLQQMDLEGVKPNEVTFVSLLDGCSREELLAEGKDVHSRIRASSFSSEIIEVDDLVVGNSVMGMYQKCGSLEDAERVFDSMQRKDVISWTTMVAAYAQEGHSRETVGVLQQMELEGIKPSYVTFLSALSVCCSSLAALERMHARIEAEGHSSNPVVQTALVSIYAKHKLLERARGVFEGMQTKDVVAWTAMIAGYTEQGQGGDARALFRQMQLEGVKPNVVTLVTMLDACSRMGALREGRELQAQLQPEAGGTKFSSVVGNALVNMYGRCGSMVDARAVLDAMQERDATTWTAVIAAYAKNGDALEALKLFRLMEMEGFKPNRLTLTTILSACSHAGLQEEAWQYFLSMGTERGIPATPEHYGCMIDLLGRAGQLEQARKMINNMPLRPDVMTWMSFLGACRLHNNVELGAQAAENVMELDARNPAPYVLLSNMYGESGKSDEAAKV